MMDRKTWVALGIIYLATWGLMYKLSLEAGRMGGFQYYASVWLLTWIPGCVGLIGARLEKFKIPIFGEPSRIHFLAFFIAWLLGIAINLRPSPHLEGSWFLDVVILYPLFVVVFGLVKAFGEFIFWWGYLHKKLERLNPLVSMVIIGIAWGVWQAPLIVLEEYYYPKHRLAGVAMMPLFTTVLGPLILYFKHKGLGIMTPAIFFATLQLSCFLRADCFYRNDLVDGLTGLNGIIVLFFCSCFALILLWRQGALKTQQNIS
jgi:hypothetical protein